ncbi:MAG TPA: DNA repair and recombination protein RadA [Nitrososphaeraceae archaeon]|nr:DNA repair and recombination protein RadA [Nitrososphaeraceae archaeon]
MINKENNHKKLELDTLDDIGPATKIHLIDAGINSLKDLIIRGPLDVAEVTGMTMEKSIDLCNKARVKLEEVDIIERTFIPATELYNKRKNIERISTGSKCFDELLGGGFEVNAITEIYGEFGSGKTQICHTSAVMVQQKITDGGLEGGVIYVDTENTFRPERIVSISKARNIDHVSVLENIVVAKAFNSAHQELIIHEIGKIIENNNIKLLVLDSAISHYRAEYLGRAMLSERQQKINRLMHVLIRISETYKIAVILTNQIQSVPDTLFGDPFRPTGGNIIAHSSTYRIYLKKAGKNRIARIVDSPYHPEIEALFSLGEEGVTDPV